MRAAGLLPLLLPLLLLLGECRPPLPVPPSPLQASLASSLSPLLLASRAEKRPGDAGRAPSARIADFWGSPEHIQRSVAAQLGALEPQCCGGMSPSLLLFPPASPAVGFGFPAELGLSLPCSRCCTHGKGAGMLREKSGECCWRQQFPAGSWWSFGETFGEVREWKQFPESCGSVGVGVMEWELRFCAGVFCRRGVHEPHGKVTGKGNALMLSRVNKGVSSQDDSGAAVIQASTTTTVKPTKSPSTTRTTETTTTTETPTTTVPTTRSLPASTEGTSAALSTSSPSTVKTSSTDAAAAQTTVTPPTTAQSNSTTASQGTPPSSSAAPPSTMTQDISSKQGTPSTPTSTPVQKSSSHSPTTPRTTPAARPTTPQQTTTSVSGNLGTSSAAQPVGTDTTTPPGAAGAVGTSPSGTQPQGSQTLSNTSGSTTASTCICPPGCRDCVVPPHSNSTTQPPPSPTSPAQGPTPSSQTGSTKTSVSPAPTTPTMSQAGTKTTIPGEAPTTPSGADHDVGSATTKPTSDSQSPDSAQPPPPAPGDQAEDCSPDLQHPNISSQNELICQDQVQYTRPTIRLKEPRTCAEWMNASNNTSFYESFCSTAQRAFDASRDRCTVKLMACKPSSQHWAVQVTLHLPLDSEEILTELKEKKDKLEQLGIFNITSDKMEDMTIKDELSTPLIITIITLAGSLLLIAAIYGCHQRFSQKKDQRLTEEMQTMENGYHDNPTLEVMETSSEMQEKKCRDPADEVDTVTEDTQK
uniref:Podocalyxin n=1 Tax=Catharus ustulatus TaxID=91951 RepID=A0A8C3VG36_CATUS